MDFFEKQDKARSRTRLLIFMFCLAVISMIVIIYVVIAVLMNFADKRPPEPGTLEFFHPEVLAIVAVGVIVVVGMSSLFKIMELRGGGQKVAQFLGGRLVNPSTTDPHERVVMNVVEEMALASGTPVPPVYVLDNEAGINAFAAGYSPNDAVIGVNRGTIETLNRSELQGVIAHEFSHILNGDMRLNIKLIGWLFGIQVLAIIGYYMFRFAGAMSSGNSRDNKGNPAIAVFVIGIVVMVVGAVGQWCARMIQAAISRQREYLADASAVQFTRDPNTIGGALKMIGASTAGSRLAVPTASEASHMFFAEGVSNFGGLSTHPPLPERIRRIDPNFDGDYSRYLKERFKKTVKPKKQEKSKKQGKDPMEMLQSLPIPGLGGGDFGPMGEMAQQMPGAEMAMNPAAMIAGIGILGEQQVQHAQQLVQQIPPLVQQAIRETFSGRCFVYCLLLDEDKSVWQKQMGIIQQTEGEATVNEIGRLLSQVRALPRNQRLPCLEIVQSTLTQLSPEQFKRFGYTVIELVRADQKIDLFEFILQHLLLSHLDRRFGFRPPVRARYKSVASVQKGIEQILSLLVHVGHESEAEAVEAFRQAARSFGEKIPFEMVPRDQCSFEVLEQALEQCSEAIPKVKKRIIEAAATAIAADGKITVDEAELFRAFAESIDCPVPPIVATDEIRKSEET